MSFAVVITQISIDKHSKSPVFVQLAEQLGQMIKDGRLKSNDKFPSTRTLASLLGLSRQTVVVAYDELVAQGFLESTIGKGTFVTKNLPIASPRALQSNKSVLNNSSNRAGYQFEISRAVDLPVWDIISGYRLDDGFPDPRIAPLKELSQAMRNQVLTKKPYRNLGYTDPMGLLKLRRELASYLNLTRGLDIDQDNILITRGTTMGMHLACKGLLSKGDIVAIGESTWNGAIRNVEQAEAIPIRIRVDSYGLDVDYLESVCQKKQIRMLYITPHHHYPTTATLRAERRLKLLELSEKYSFVIFEDDYDYDFHYQSKPLMPLASDDRLGMVLYCGSFTKAISPAFRVGYLVGPKDVISFFAKLRRFVDRQGDVVLEGAVADLIQEGIIQRHLRKSLRIYRERRDRFCDLLRTQLGAYASFDTPEGGMAVWTRFDPKLNLSIIASKALANDLYFSDGSQLNMPANLRGCTRLGFASSTLDELEICVSVLKKVIQS